MHAGSLLLPPPLIYLASLLPPPPPTHPWRQLAQHAQNTLSNMKEVIN